MKTRFYILLVLVLSLNACKTRSKQVINAKVTELKKDSLLKIGTLKEKEIVKSFDLDFKFKVNAGQEEDFQTFKTYSYFELSKSGKIIYVDKSLEYEFGNKLYPMVIQTGQNKFELLVEINDRPSINYIKIFIIKDDKVLKIDTLPAFISKPSDLNNDGTKEYAGLLDHGEIWGKQK
ncbi:MAG: hypothetical protein PHT07_17740 [Paludibacter sp.]|nr:hypothetical protein [Paludibacter sp.]